MPLSEKYGQKLRDVGALNKCPMCGHDDWLFVNDGDELTGVMTSTALKYFATVTLGCKRCGFMSQHSVAVLDDSLENGDDHE